MKKYMEPELEIATFEVEDVITTSGGQEFGGGSGNNQPDDPGTDEWD